MARTGNATGRAPRRAIGVRAGLDLDQILEAARLLAPDTLTMQALADQLGVDRKALNHHVRDRETLLALIAADIFATAFARVDIHPDTPWQDACRLYAHGFTESAIATDVLADRIRPDDAYVAEVLAPTEIVLQTMTRAGFDDETAMRVLSLLTNICLAHARDVVIASRSGVQPRPAILRKALEHQDSPKLEVLARIARLTATTYDARQLELSVEVFVAGAQSVLAGQAPG